PFRPFTCGEGLSGDAVGNANRSRPHPRLPIPIAPGTRIFHNRRYGRPRPGGTTMNVGADATSGRDNATQDPPRPLPSAETAAGLARVLAGYMADLQAGRAPDRDRLLADHPEIAAELEQCLAGIEFIQRAIGDPGGEPARLGDFRILREVGRGGMGVVYEAE